ncbi:MAG TPA: YqgE/AlgH family protein [Myxococcaceae bacterium]
MKLLTPRLLLALLIVTGLLLLGLFPRLFDRFREQDRPPRAPVPGLLLVARPDSVDRNFDKTVVLLVEVGAERTWGLVLNRLRTPEGEALPADASRWGGPARQEFRTTLLRAAEPPPGAHRLLPGLVWHEGPAREASSPEFALTFTGLAVWRPGQLEHELEQGAWLQEEGSAEKVFSDPTALWAECLAPHL